MRIVKRGLQPRLYWVGEIRPIEALLDLYTIKNHLGGIEGLKVVIVGDILYSRVARSNLWGLIKMGADVTLCANWGILEFGSCSFLTSRVASSTSTN